MKQPDSRTPKDLLDDLKTISESGLAPTNLPIGGLERAAVSDARERAHHSFPCLAGLVQPCAWPDCECQIKAGGAMIPPEELPGMLAVAKGVAEQKWPHTMDAKTWATEFCKLFHPVGKNPPYHAMNATEAEELMIGWFANAIMAGYDTAQARAVPSERGDSWPFKAVGYIERDEIQWEPGMRPVTGLLYVSTNAAPQGESEARKMDGEQRATTESSPAVAAVSPDKQGLLADLKKIGEFLPHEPDDTETSEWHHWIELDEAYSRLAFALESLPSATRESVIDECIAVCRKEYLEEPVKDTGDEDYDNAIKHCVDALHELKQSYVGEKS